MQRIHRGGRQPVRPEEIEEEVTRHDQVASNEERSEQAAKLIRDDRVPIDDLDRAEHSEPHAVSLAAESREVTTAELEQIHRLKTGALIVAAARCGAIVADVPATTLAAITEYAAQLGLLFQIADDLLDITATAETLGKTPGKDLRSKKATYPALYGMEAAHKHLTSAHAAACAALDKIQHPTPLLRAIADFNLQRKA